MWWTKASGLEDRDQLTGIDLIECFDAWLTERLDEAHAAGKDLAFFDTRLERKADGRHVGWSHVLLDPGCHPPLGETWTVYRLQAQPD
ncbi:MAG TPA: hypothetical protein VFW47_02515 [Phenylobacterium sp.]|nr:hypothetical protein [Phenylobacterium sp.]